jgi:hypothetical protein
MLHHRRMFHIGHQYRMLDIDSMEHFHSFDKHHQINSIQHNSLKEQSNINYYASINNKQNVISTIHIHITIFSCPRIHTIAYCNNSSCCSSFQTTAICTTWTWITWIYYFEKKINQKRRSMFLLIFCFTKITYHLLFHSSFHSILLHSYTNNSDHLLCRHLHFDIQLMAWLHMDE